MLDAFSCCFCSKSIRKHVVVHFLVLLKFAQSIALIMCVMFRWIRDQQKSEGVLDPGDDVFIILRLDGRVRKSGKV